jgi:hypothetical protein
LLIAIRTGALARHTNKQIVWSHTGARNHMGRCSRKSCDTHMSGTMGFGFEHRLDRKFRKLGLEQVPPFPPALVGGSLGTRSCRLRSLSGARNGPGWLRG